MVDTATGSPTSTSPSTTRDCSTAAGSDDSRFGEGVWIGTRPSELLGIERRDVDRARRIATVRGTKTHGSLRQVPLSRRALEALDRLPRLAPPLLFPNRFGERVNLHNFSRRI